MSRSERQLGKRADPKSWQLRIGTDPSAALAHLTNPVELQEESTSGEYKGMTTAQKIGLGLVAVTALGVAGGELFNQNEGENPGKQSDVPSNTRVVETQNASNSSTHQMNVSTPDGEKTVTFELPPTETAGPALPPPPEQYAPGEQPDIEH